MRDFFIIWQALKMLDFWYDIYFNIQYDLHNSSFAVRSHYLQPYEHVNVRFMPNGHCDPVSLVLYPGWGVLRGEIFCCVDNGEGF